MNYRAAGAMVLALSLAGCGSSERLPPCPKVFMSSDISTLTRFRPGGGRDLTDVEFQTELLGYEGSCKYEKNKVTINLAVGFGVSRGPAAGREAQFEYFVAIPKLYPSKAAKVDFDVAYPYPAGQARGEFKDEVEIDMPFTDRSTVLSNEIYIGLQLTAEELEYNRKQRER
jgi:hypothetical protein